MGKVFLLIIFYMNTNLASVQTIQQDVSSMSACENMKMQILKDLEDEASASKVKLAKCYLSK